MPGHDVVVPVDATPCGGARGRHERSKVSMTSMCPPQHGHGGRTSGGSTGASVVAGGATPSSWRTWSRRTLRVALRRWQIGLVSLAAALKKRYVIEDDSSRAMCDLGPCPPPRRAEIIADTLASLPSRVLPRLQLSALTAAAGKESYHPNQFRGPLRIASSGDPKMDTIFRSVIARLGTNSGLPLDARSFPVPLARANVLIASLGRWDAFPVSNGRNFDQAVARWGQERKERFPWRFSAVTPATNPLFAFVAAKASGDARAISARLVRGRFDETPLIAVGPHGDIVAGACAPGSDHNSVEECIRAISLHPSLSRDNRRWRSKTGCQSDSTTPRGVLARLATAVDAILRWIIGILS